MNKKNKAVIGWLIAAILLFFVVKDSPYINYYHLSPVAAHEQSERTYHYGPSEVVEEIDLGKVRIYLGKYKNWFSANMVVKHAGVFWQPGSHVGGTEINPIEDISFSWSGSTIDKDLYVTKFYGIVTNPKIVKIELDVEEQLKTTTLTYALNSHRMFIFHWNELEHRYKWLTLRGLDENGHIIYEKKLY